MTRKRNFISKAKGSIIWWFLPVVIMLTFFYLYPLLEVFRLSFTNASFVESDYSYTIRSYIRIFTSSSFYFTLKITVIYVAACVVGQLGIGQAIALLLDQGERRGLRGVVLTRTIVLMGWIMPGVIAGIIWNMLLSSSPYGLVNYIIRSLGFEPLPFLHSSTFSLVAIIIANTWRGTAFSMILQYAGLKQIPQLLYEAAVVDGASPLQQYFYITLPQLRNVIFINLVLITVGTFNTFEMILSLTGGGPGISTEVLALRTYTEVFRSFNLSGGAGYAIILFAINLIMALTYFRLISKEN